MKSWSHSKFNNYNAIMLSIFTRVCIRSPGLIYWLQVCALKHLPFSSPQVCPQPLGPSISLCFQELGYFQIPPISEIIQCFLMPSTHFCSLPLPLLSTFLTHSDSSFPLSRISPSLVLGCFPIPLSSHRVSPGTSTISDDLVQLSPFSCRAADAILPASFDS